LFSNFGFRYGQIEVLKFNVWISIRTYRYMGGGLIGKGKRNYKKRWVRNGEIQVFIKIIFLTTKPTTG
jgi:hypothetical protein